MTQVKTPEEIAAEIQPWLPGHGIWNHRHVRTLITQGIKTDRAQRDDVIEKVRAYAADRAAHARHPILNQVGSGRIASDLFQILGLPDPFPEDEEVTEPEVVNCIHCSKPVEWVYDGVISDWKHADPDGSGRTYWHCSEGESENEAEAPEGTPHP